MSYLAGTIVNVVRDLVPDPAYSSGTPQPDADGGLFRASTLYRWLDSGVRLLCQRTGWTLTDWWAMAALANQPFYTVDPKFHTVESVFARQQHQTLIKEAPRIYPSRGTETQSIEAFIHRVTDHLEVGFYPIPSTDDPVTTLNGSITATATSLVVVSATGFLSYGYLMIDSELLQYQAVAGASVTALTRGCGGTTAATHANAATVTHLSLWVYGRRTPGPIAASTSVVEVPLGWVSLLESYLLSQCRRSEQEHQEARGLMKEFDDGCARIARERGVILPVNRQTAAAEAEATVPEGPPQVAQTAR